jgi:hypothetical protein
VEVHGAGPPLGDQLGHAGPDDDGRRLLEPLAGEAHELLTGWYPCAGFLAPRWGLVLVSLARAT